MTTSTLFTVTTTTTPIPLCPICGLVSREATWLSLYSVDTSLSMKVTSARRALDGNSGTWGGAETWVMDLRTVHQISTLRINWRSCQCASDGALIMERSVDGESWETFATPTLYEWGLHSIQTYAIDAAARWLKINITEISPSRYMTFWEIEVFGFPDIAGPPQAFVPEAIAGRPSNGEPYTCRYAQEYASSEQLFTQCRTHQEWWQQACCIPPTPTSPRPTPVPIPTPAAPTPTSKTPNPTPTPTFTPTSDATPTPTSKTPSSAPTPTPTPVSTIQGSVDVVVTNVESFVTSPEVRVTLGGFVADLAGSPPEQVTILSVRLRDSALRRLQPGGGSVVVDWLLDLLAETVSDRTSIIQKLLATDLQQATLLLTEALAGEVPDSSFDAFVVRISVQGATTTIVPAATMPPYMVQAKAETLDRVRLAIGVVAAAILVFILVCLAWLMVSKLYVLSTVSESGNAEVACPTKWSCASAEDRSRRPSGCSNWGKQAAQDMDCSGAELTAL